MFADEFDALFCEPLPLLFGADNGTNAHVVFINWHEGDERLKDVPDGPRWLPMFWVIVREGEADLLFDLEATTRCQENNIGRLEGITTR